jgi:hypothetical protein
MNKIPQTSNTKAAETKKIPQGIYFITSGVIFLLGAIALIWWTSSYNSWKLREQLQILSPLFLEINFFLIIIAIGINIKTFKEVFAGIPRRMWLFLGGVTIIGLLITMFVVPREHRIYYDEDIYQNIGQNIAFLKDADANRGEDLGESLQHLWKRIVGRAAMCNEGKNEYGEYSCYKLEYNKEPNGWAYTLSVVFRLFGVHEIVAFLTANFLYGLSILTAFFIGYLLFGSPLSGIFAALVLALTPELMIWSNTTAVEPSAAFFPGLALLGVLIFIKSRETKALFLAVVMSAFAVQFRPESIMFLAVIGLLIFLLCRDELVKGEFYLLISIFFILIIPHLVHLWAVKEMGWGSSGPKFSTDFFQGNFRVNGLFYLRNLRFPLVFAIFFGLGLVLKRGKEGVAESYFFLKEKLVVFTWFLLFWGIFLFFYAGSYNYGADVRFSLLSAMPIALIAGNGAASLSQLLIQRLKLTHVNYFITAIIIFAFLPFLPFVRAITQEAWGARADHHYAKEMVKALPPDSLVLTHNPNIFLFLGKSAAQASLATEQRSYFNRFFYRYKGGIYFHYNFWCNVPDRQQNSFCTNILEKFDSEAVLSFKEKSYTFELYKLEKKAKKPVLNE